MFWMWCTIKRKPSIFNKWKNLQRDNWQCLNNIYLLNFDFLGNVFQLNAWMYFKMYLCCTTEENILLPEFSESLFDDEQTKQKVVAYILNIAFNWWFTMAYMISHVTGNKTAIAHPYSALCVLWGRTQQHKDVNSYLESFSIMSGAFPSPWLVNLYKIPNHSICFSVHAIFCAFSGTLTSTWLL